MKQRLQRHYQNVILRLRLRHRPKAPPGPVERRIKIDPRYRDPNYPEFVCRRKNPFHYEDLQPRKGHSLLHPEHAERKTFLTLGLATGLVLLALLALVLFSLQKPDTRLIHKCTGTVNPVVGL